MFKTFFKKNYLSFLLGLILIISLYFISLYSYILYHSFVELFSIIIAFGIFIFTWNSKKFLDNNYLLFVGISYFFVALLDLLHTLTYKGMNIFIGFDGANTATQLWISARYFESISLILALFFITRKLNYIVQFVCYMIAITLILLSIFFWKTFPASYIEESGLTIFKVISEYIISFILIAVIFLINSYRKEFNRIIFTLIISSLFLTVLSELSFTFYTDVYGLFNQLGHFLKLVSFYLIFKAIIVTGFSQPFNLLFFKLKQREKDIKESEEKFRSLYFSMNEGVCLHEMIYDKSGKPVDYIITDINDAYESIIGYKRDQVVGKKASEVYKTENAPYMNIYSRVTDTGKPDRFETYFSPMKKYFSISVFSPFRGKFATIFTDITQRKKAERFNLKIGKERTLTEERNKLARELHDTVSQTLFSANLITEAIPKLWEKDPEAVMENLEKVRQLNNFALMELRVLLYELRPSTLKYENLEDLLKKLVESFTIRSKIKIKLIIDGKYKFPAKIEISFYRIAQEALNNIIKHSHATKSSLVLKIRPQELYMKIADNGHGFDYKKNISTNLGLSIMNKRAKLIKAPIIINSLSGKGTEIIVIYNKKNIKVK